MKWILIALLVVSFLLNVLSVSVLREKIVSSCENEVDIQKALDSGGLRIDN
jgi:hypothetical protein